ncbi:sensor histidine kinase [Persicitalea jodogahamensis]|uniref:histidine kinase n=1 Tax=Persicitalea jodogahamensis TaxID=402147 RepID=A0A8J3DDW4_9BACT|nr:response regulator [Persicitalea jodogahamensis]GHB87082.1 hybrid sensor histidine kinase/response regulator [Persicitalea jodogahamensis]
MILIVDDTQDNLYSLRTLLQLNSYDVDTAASGEEALLKILKKEYRLIILDVQMPGMDGFEVAETITGYSKTRDIPILFLSAVNVDKRFITRGYASGGVDYITKPFDADLLLLKVKTFCRLYDQTRQLQNIQMVLRDEIENRKQAQGALEDLNARLEDHVEERTRELRLANGELEVRNTELAQFASLASHDLQEPLRKIITFGQLLESKYLANQKEATELSQKINASAERMRKLINDLLNYSRLSALSLFEPVDLNELLQDTLQNLEIAISEKNAVIRAEPLPPIEAIPGQMRQVFQNLIGNALKFSQKGIPPLVTIRGGYIAEGDLAAPWTTQGDYIRICIADRGIGFDEIYLGKIFAIFQRLHTQREYEGTGIGLAIVKKIVDKHKGLISAKSKPYEGTTFSIVLPIRQSQPLIPDETPA